MEIFVGLKLFKDTISKEAERLCAPSAWVKLQVSCINNARKPFMPTFYPFFWDCTSWIVIHSLNFRWR